MKTITDNTRLEQRAVMFADGAKGYYEQHYQLFVDGEPIDISMCIKGHSNRNDSIREFYYKGIVFTEMKNAFIYAGYEWARK